MKKKTKRVLATAMAGLSLFGLVGCGPNTTQNDAADNDSKYETQLQNQQQKLDEQQQKMAEQQQVLDGLQSQLKDMQTELKSAQEDIKNLKEADKQLEKLIKSNMSTVTQSYNSLLQQVNDLAKNYDSFAGDISALQTQYSALNTQMQGLSELLTNLQSTVESLQQNTTTQDLTDTIKSMQSRINQLVVQNALNLTLNTRYNRIYRYENQAFNGLIYANPNGEYCFTNNAQDPELTIIKNGLKFDHYGNTEVATAAAPVMSVVSPLLYGDYYNVEGGNCNYTVTSPVTFNTTTIRMDSIGYITELSTIEPNGTTYSVQPTDAMQYQAAYSEIESHFTLIEHYETVNDAIDTTFNNKYVLMTAEMTANGNASGEGKVLVGQRRGGLYHTTVEQEQETTGYTLFGKNENVAVVESNGKVSVEDSSNVFSGNITPKMVGESLKTSLFNNEFKIEVDETTNSFTITRGDQSFTIVIDEDGKLSDYELNPENTGLTNMRVTCHIEGIDKQRFETEYKQIKDKVDELIELYNSNLGV